MNDLPRRTEVRSGKAQVTLEASGKNFSFYVKLRGKFYVFCFILVAMSVWLSLCSVVKGSYDWKKIVSGE